MRAQAVGAPEPASSLSRASARPVCVGPRARPRRGHAGLPVGSLRPNSFLMRGSEKLLSVASWRLHFLPFETKPSSCSPALPSQLFEQTFWNVLEGLCTRPRQHWNSSYFPREVPINAVPPEEG